MVAEYSVNARRTLDHEPSLREAVSFALPTTDLEAKEDIGERPTASSSGDSTMLRGEAGRATHRTRHSSPTPSRA